MSSPSHKGNTRKRPRVSDGSETESDVEEQHRDIFISQESTQFPSLGRIVSPPHIREPLDHTPAESHKRTLSKPHKDNAKQQHRDLLPSPVSLTTIKDLPLSSNVDTVSLSDILEDPLIKEVWIFNYLHDVEFIMSALDSDVRDTVQIKIVHGSWKSDDRNRANIAEMASRYANVEVIIAYMPEPFGTHHSKAFFILRHDDLAQVIIHTANMVTQDWTNLTQAVWRSPLLPLLKDGAQQEKKAPIGSGLRFKADILNYLRHYGKRTARLTKQLEEYDFAAVRGALIASVPCKQELLNRTEIESEVQTTWGWQRLREVLEAVPSDRSKSLADKAQIVVQVSSVASLGPKNRWLTSFLHTLSTETDAEQEKPNNMASRHITEKRDITSNATHHIIFPTDDEVRRSLDGYMAGGAIHMKIQTPAQQEQLAHLRPLLRHWEGPVDSPDRELSEVRELAEGEVKGRSRIQRAKRARAAPHIKTYIRFSSSRMDRIDWAMLTSANLSKQAWGELEKGGVRGGDVRIASYELGVMFWPALFDDAVAAEVDGAEPKRLECKTVMLPVFGKDLPSNEDGSGQRSIGFRMPYDVPLRPYTRDDMPWCATGSYAEPDWRGMAWNC